MIDFLFTFALINSSSHLDPTIRFARVENFIDFSLTITGHARSTNQALVTTSVEVFVVFVKKAKTT